MPIERWQVDHGTPGGERWHYRHGEKPCETCRNARNEKNRERHRARHVARVHALLSDGRPRCGHANPRPAGEPGREVTCGRCLLILGAAA